MSLKLPRNWDFNLKMDAAKIGTVTVSLCPSVSASAFQVQAGVCRGACGQAQQQFRLWPTPEPTSGLGGGTWPLATAFETADGLQIICTKLFAKLSPRDAVGARPGLWLRGGCLSRVGNGGTRQRGAAAHPKSRFGGDLNHMGSFCWRKPCRR